jgi:hypothetical protein
MCHCELCLGDTAELANNELFATRFIVGCVCSGIGVLGMCWFWLRWKSNYVWICNNIFMYVYNHTALFIQTHYFSPRPGALSGVQGVIATLATNYGQNNKLVFVGSSKWTLVATGGVTVVCGVLIIIYMFIVLRRVQKEHDMEYGERHVGKRGAGAGFNDRKASGINITW